MPQSSFTTMSAALWRPVQTARLAARRLPHPRRRPARPGGRGAVPRLGRCPRHRKHGAESRRRPGLCPGSRLGTGRGLAAPAADPHVGRASRVSGRGLARRAARPCGGPCAGKAACVRFAWMSVWATPLPSACMSSAALRAPAQPRCTSASAPSTRAVCTRKRCDTGQHAERRPCAPGRPARPYFAAPHRRSLPQHPRRHACGCLRPRLSRFRLLLLDTKRYRFSRCRAKAAFSDAKGGPAPRAAGAGAGRPVQRAGGERSTGGILPGLYPPRALRAALFAHAPRPLPA